MVQTVERHFWIDLIEHEWRERSVVWLAGVRRVGKTCLSQSLPNIEYFDCELPRARRMMEDVEGFLESMNGRRIVLDEIHRLRRPSELLKVAADHYPKIQVLATGSSTLGASRKFKDTLAGRKRDIWLTPLCSADLNDFRNPNLGHRLLRGGLPPFFMAKELPERDFQEWIDAYWAKDIQELFRVEKRSSFQRFAELIMMQSGGIFEAKSFAAPCEVSRQTITNYLKVLETTFTVHVIRPFSARRPNEIVAAPKTYAFDTGFICYYRGWNGLSAENRGALWEHYVLNEMMARMQSRRINYWRDKRGHEVDFIVAGRGAQLADRGGRQGSEGAKPVAIECKWSAEEFDGGGLIAFRRQYPMGENYVVAQDVVRSYVRSYGGIKVRFIGLSSLGEYLLSRGGRKNGSKSLEET
jgi:predicted AAA+ superfamily ATPase